MKIWFYTTPLTSGLVQIIPLGTGGASTIADYTNELWTTWNIITQLDAELRIDGCMDLAFAAGVTRLITQAITGGTLATPYNLAAPYSNTGAVLLTMPFIRLTLADSAAGNHTYTQFFARSWG
jgi:hypothetical protein